MDPDHVQIGFHAPHGDFFGSVKSLAAEKIRISVSGGYNMIFPSSDVAQQRGFFRDAGLDAAMDGPAPMTMISPPWDFEGKKSSYNVLVRAYDYLNYPLSGLGVNAKDGLKLLIEQGK